jgi:hypothetical protein
VVSDALPNQLELLGHGYVHGLVGQLPFEMGRLTMEVLYELVQEGENAVSEEVKGTNIVEHVFVPLLLPELNVDQNLIGNLWYVGFILFGLIASTSISFGIWVWCYRRVRVVKVSQPMFLIMVAIGVMVMGATLVPLSFDDSAMTECTLTCRVIPWLGSLGFTITFSALFSKTWRVNKIFHAKKAFAKITVTEKDVILPFVLLLMVNVVVLICWTVLDPLTYVREAHKGLDGWNRILSTYGSCESNNPVPYLAALAVVNGGVLVVTNWQAYEARFIESEFSESRYIGFAVASMLQACLSGIPVLLVVKEMPQAYYLVLTVTIFIVCMAILLLIFVPKMAFAQKVYLPRSVSQQDSLISNSIRRSQAQVKARRSFGNGRAVHEPSEEANLHDRWNSVSYQDLPPRDLVMLSSRLSESSSDLALISASVCSLKSSIEEAMKELSQEGNLEEPSLSPRGSSIRETEDVESGGSSSPPTGEESSLDVLSDKLTELSSISASVSSIQSRIEQAMKTNS